MSRNLAASIRARLKRHADMARQDFNLTLTRSVPSGLGDAFVSDATKQIQWHAFLKKNGLDAIALADVATLLRTEFRKAAIL